MEKYEKWDWDQGYGSDEWGADSWKSWKSWSPWEKSDNKEGDNNEGDHGDEWKQPEVNEPEPEESIQKFSVILDQYTSNFPCPFDSDWVWIRMRRPPPAVCPHVVPAKRKVENWKDETEEVACED